ncbi:MAG: class I SAM-dependent methyltransferase [Gammaproteobacteria bacterium]
MAGRLARELEETWNTSGFLGIARRVARKLRTKVRRALNPLFRLLRESRTVLVAAGPAGLLRHLGQRIRLFVLRLAGRGQSEAELASETMRYWNEGDKAGINLGDYSHWVDTGPWQDRDKWLALGRVHFEMYEQLCKAMGTPRPLRNAVEWGSGGGANAIHFIHEVKEYCGIEIAQASLVECERVLAEAGFNGFRPVLVSAESPETALELAPEPFDLFLSTYVFELLPSRSYGERVARIAWQLLKPGGLALIQIRYDDGSPRSTQKNADYFRHASRFTSYRVEEFWTKMEAIGFQPLYVKLVPRLVAGYSGDLYAYFAMRRPD